TRSIEATRSVTTKRQLNAPSECFFTFLPGAQGLPLPSRYARLIVSDSGGLVLFTGYIATPPAMELVGGGVSGPLYEVLVTAISDEVLLNSLLSVKKGTALNQPVVQALQTVTSLAGAPALTISAQSTPAVIGRYTSRAASSWSEAAGSLASSSRGAYRMIAGVTSLTPVGAVTHALSETNGSLQLSALKLSTVKLLANDITICGKTEPAAYVTETFQGDGVTAAFTLTNLPFEPVTSERMGLVDLFQGATLNGQVWNSIDSGSRLSITANGVTCSEGTGRDGETVLSAIDQIELGGSILLEAGGVQVGAGSQGLLLGLYTGSVSLANCFASFQVSQASGSTQIGALINGALAGNLFLPVAQHVYTLRMRVYSPEMERVQPSYYYLDETGPGSYGGTVIVAPGRLVMEVQDVTSGIPGGVTVLYDGTISSLPAACTMGLLDSGNMVCSIKSFDCKQGGPTWVNSVVPGGTPASQYLGTVAQGGSCKLDSMGKLTFYPANIPVANAVISVKYRTRHRAVARRSVARSGPQAGQSSAAPPTEMWMGTVREPAAWSSADCDNAAAALLKSAAVASAGWAGTYTAWNFDAAGDVWPGDVLALQSVSTGLDVAVVVREVQIELGCATPQLVKYIIRFANDWAEDLAIKLSNTVPEDAWLPATPSAGGAPLDNLTSMVVTSITGSQIIIDAGVVPPPGGGLEVKRKDWTFGPGTDSDLVLRTPVRSFIIPREAALEQYYVRMYDGSNPPNYSQLSSAVYVEIPLGGS
ncbi:MAG TPA: hypothetical protein VGD62_07485, partial [Acidobacteriaceae bacterium]